MFLRTWFNNAELSLSYSKWTPVTLKHLEESTLALQYSSKKTITILDLACGESPGLEAQQYFANHGIAIKYIGVDINTNLIEISKKYHKSQSMFSFHVVDASDPRNLKGILEPHSADLIICQHPLICGGNYSEKIKRMLSQTLPYYLSETTGRVYISFYHEIEAEAFVALKLFQFKNPDEFKFMDFTDGERCYVKNEKNMSIEVYHEQFVFISLVSMESTVLHRYDDLVQDEKQSTSNPLASHRQSQFNQIAQHTRQSCSPCALFNRFVAEPARGAINTCLNYNKQSKRSL